MMLTRGKVALVAVLLTAGALRAAPTPEENPLRYKFKEGEKLKYVLDQKMTMEMSILGMDVTIEMTQVMDMTWAVDKVDKNGKATMTQTIGRVQMTMDTPMGKVELDSAKKEDPDDPIGKMIAPMIRAMAGAEITATMNPRGELRDIKLSEKFKKALKNVPQGGGGFPGFGDMFSEEGMKQMMSQGGLILPEKEPKVKDTWANKVEQKSEMGKMIVDSKYTYLGSTTENDKKFDKIGIKGDLKIEPKEDAQATIKLKSQDMEGTALFDRAAGRLVKTNATQNMTMDVSAMGQDITMKMKQVITMKLADGKETKEK